MAYKGMAHAFPIHTILLILAGYTRSVGWLVGMNISFMRPHSHHTHHRRSV